jgi:hypothetical protein
LLLRPEDGHTHKLRETKKDRGRERETVTDRLRLTDALEARYMEVEDEVVIIRAPCATADMIPRYLPT